MKPIIIYTYDYSPGVGGIKVMHKLCDLLNKNGYVAYLYPIHWRDEFYTCANYDTPIVTQEIVDNLDQAIVVYPEGIKYNPLNAKNVVRWILGPPKEEDTKTYSKTDIIYWFLDHYYVDTLGQKENQLSVIEFHDDIFTNIGYARAGSCYTFRKASPVNLIHPANATFIPFNSAGDLTGLATLFNTSEKFYSYDIYTFLSIQAAMCGCISIVVPDPEVSREKWLQGASISRYGIAYGEDDIPRAIETLPLLFKEIEKIKLEAVERVHNFVRHCNNVF